jgi:hypothetical protein
MIMFIIIITIKAINLILMLCYNDLITNRKSKW